MRPLPEDQQLCCIQPEKSKSRIDLRVGGNIKYKGNNNKQGIDGIIKIAENESKLYFKGHEFKVTKGDIRFRKNADALDPYFDLVSDTKIGD